MNCTESPPDKLLLPSDMVPSINVTEPVGVPPADGCTVAVKITDWPNVAGFRFDATLVVAVACVTVCVRVPEVLPAKLPSPLYFAVMECDPGVKFEIASCAALLEIVTAPRDVVPSRNVMPPVAEPPKLGTTFAVNVMDCANAAGLAFDETVVVVAVRLIVSVSGSEVLAALFGSPLYFAVSVLEPTDKVETDSCAVLLAIATVPNGIAPLKKATLPVTAPLPDGCTAATRVTA